MNAGADCNFVEGLTWDKVGQRIAGGAAAILPIGAGAKQHGFHLPMNADRVQAEWLAANLAEQIDALIWPTVTYGHYPAFVEYAGSVSLSTITFEAMVREIATGILSNGCRMLFVLDTGLSTIEPVARALAGLDRSVHLRIHGGARYRDAAQRLATQRQGSHADELETSVMLAIAPRLVDMTRAEASPFGNGMAPGPLTPADTTSPNYSRSGSYGDPSLATEETGRVLVAAMIDDISEQVLARSSLVANEPRESARSTSQ